MREGVRGEGEGGVGQWKRQSHVYTWERGCTEEWRGEAWETAERGETEREEGRKGGRERGREGGREREIRERRERERERERERN